MSNILIISQNLFNYRKKNTILPGDYIKKYDADYYAFQEYPDYSGRGRTFYTTIVNAQNQDISKNNYDEINNVWNMFFPWTKMPFRYWSETKIEVKGKEIFLINVHISTSYAEPLRLILLQRLKQLKDKRVILMGDFNAAFTNQTELVIKENSEFLSMIIKSGYVELLGKDETDANPHYTFAIEDKKKKRWIRKKLDHVFVSKVMKDNVEIDTSIEYLDSTNMNFDKIFSDVGFKNDGISDHTGIRINVKDENP